jgi:hypothetical protein
MPSGRKSTISTKAPPTKTSQYSRCLLRKSRIQMKTPAPTKGPSKVPVPPKSVMISTEPDIDQWMFSIGTNSSTTVSSAPASPEKKPEIRNATSFTRRVS